MEVMFTSQIWEEILQTSYDWSAVMSAVALDNVGVQLPSHLYKHKYVNIKMKINPCSHIHDS